MTHLPQAEVMLPHGCWQDGACHREALVRALPEGEDLEAEPDTAALPITRSTALLARCVTRFGGLNGQDSLGEEAIGNLPMGDREALLLHIRRATFGNRADCILRCLSCRQNMEFQVLIDDLLAPPATDPKAHYEGTFVEDDITFQFKFHLPTAKDVEAAIHAVRSVSPDAVRALAVRCVESVERSMRQDPAKRAIRPEEWPTGLVGHVSQRMEELDPQAEIQLQVMCPTCGQEFAAFFDVAEFFVEELKERERSFHEQVHQLALAYHWCEADIAKLTPRKRKIYLDLIAGEGVYE